MVDKSFLNVSDWLEQRFVKKCAIFCYFDESVTDRQTDGPTDGQTLLQRCEVASKNTDLEEDRQFLHVRSFKVFGIRRKTMFALHVYLYRFFAHTFVRNLVLCISRVESSQCAFVVCVRLNFLYDHKLRDKLIFRTNGQTDLLGRFKTLYFWAGLKHYNLRQELCIFVTYYKSITD